MFLLDTDTFSEIARARHAGLMRRVAQRTLSDINVSIVTVAEVRFGQAIARLPAALSERIDQLLASLRPLPLDARIVSPYAGVRAYLQRKGSPIGPNDLWLAAHALAENLTLVTGNEREFGRVPGLRVENWMR